jgi:hypothetical protein
MPFVDLEKVRVDNKRLMDRIRTVAEESFRLGARQALSELRANPPFKTRTGRLIKSTRADVISGGLSLTVKIRASAPYASYLEHGTDPHVIRPRGIGGLLTFYWNKVGSVVHFKKVNHPGTKATHFLRKTRDRAIALGRAELANRLQTTK